MKARVCFFLEKNFTKNKMIYFFSLTLDAFMFALAKVDAWDDGRYAPRRFRFILNFIGLEHPANNIALAVGKPLLQHLITAEAVVPDGGRNVAPLR